jgi:hypothetical protein
MTFEGFILDLFILSTFFPPVDALICDFSGDLATSSDLFDALPSFSSFPAPVLTDFLREPNPVVV